MGEIIDLNKQPELSEARILAIDIMSPVIIERIEIVRNNIVIKTIKKKFKFILNHIIIYWICYIPLFNICKMFFYIHIRLRLLIYNKMNIEGQIMSTGKNINKSKSKQRIDKGFFKYNDGKLTQAEFTRRDRDNGIMRLFEAKTHDGNGWSVEIKVDRPDGSTHLQRKQIRGNDLDKFMKLQNKNLNITGTDKKLIKQGKHPKGKTKFQFDGRPNAKQLETLHTKDELQELAHELNLTISKDGKMLKKSALAKKIAKFMETGNMSKYEQKRQNHRLNQRQHQNRQHQHQHKHQHQNRQYQHQNRQYQPKQQYQHQNRQYQQPRRNNRNNRQQNQTQNTPQGQAKSLIEQLESMI